jgi:predicted MPP superfamily phosphohydrolase
MVRTPYLGILKWICWQAALLGVSLILINRWLILWVDGPGKTLALTLVALAAVVAALWLSLQLSLATIVAPGLVVLLLGVGELRRIWLRNNYRAHATSVTSLREELAHPITTTALTTRLYRVAAPKGTPRLRIAQLTDFHFDDTLPDTYFDAVFSRVRESKPDMIVLTGDFVSHRTSLPKLQRLMPHLAIPRLGAFAVLGNHDYWSGADGQVRENLAALGIHVLGGTCEYVAQQDAKRIAICGDERPWGPVADTSTTLPDDFVIVLSHTPDNIYDWSKRASVMFAGHNHGGQFRVPALGALVVPSIYGRRFDWGQFEVDRITLFVSAGIGADSPPLRLFCPPEVVVADLSS